MGKLSLSKERFQGIGFELAKVLMMFSLVSEVLCFLLAAYTKDTRFTALCMFLLLIPMYSVLIRRLIKNFFLFFLAHAALYGLIFLFHDVVPMVVIGAYVTADVIYIYVRKISGVNDPMSVALLFLSFVVALGTYLLCTSMEVTFLRPMILCMFLLQIMIYLIYFHQMNIHDTLSANTQSASQSIRKINSLNNKVIIMFIGVLLVLIGAGVLMRLDVAISLIGRGLLALLKVVVRFLFRGGDSAPVEETIVEETEGGGDMGSGVPEGYEPWMIWIILEKIMTVLAVVIVIALIAYVFYRLYQKFRMDRVEEDVLSDYAETPVFIERARPEKKERMSLRERLNLPNDKKIRRLFRKKVRARIKAGDPITAAQTPQEICRTVKAEDLSRLTGLYEKARYSDIPITKEDVQSVS